MEKFQLRGCETWRKRKVQNTHQKIIGKRRLEKYMQNGGGDNRGFSRKS